MKFLIVETIFNLAKVNTVPCMFTGTLSLSLSLTASRWRDSLPYIESITDDSQYCVGIEHTGNNKHYQKCKLLLEQVIGSFRTVFS